MSHENRNHWPRAGRGHAARAIAIPIGGVRDIFAPGTTPMTATRWNTSGDPQASA